MLSTKDSFSFGRLQSCDLCVDDETYVSSLHMQIDRLEESARASLKVTDVSPGKNDIVFLGEIAEKEFTMGAGDWFEIGESRFFAMNEQMRLARPTAMDVLGLGQHAAIDDLLIAAVRDSARHVLLVGEPGCDQDRLGRVIHQVSHRRHNRYHTLSNRPKLDAKTRQELSDACNGTVLVPMHHRGKLDPRLVAALVHPQAKLRLILCAKSPDKAEASFAAGLVNDAKKITIPALRERTNELPELLDQWFFSRRSLLRFGLLRPELRDALRSYGWPENLSELRQVTDVLVKLVHFRTPKQAEAEITRGVIRGWTKRLNVSFKFPLVLNRSE
jgi:hypothetical protein